MADLTNFGGATIVQLQTEAVSLQNKTTLLADVAPIGVVQFGAVGDGINDDTKAIVAAIAAAQSGQVVVFTPGTYNVSSTIVTAIPLTLQFQRGATLFLINNSNCDLLTVSSGSTVLGGGTLDFNGANQTGNLFALNLNNTCRVQNIEIKNYLWTGIGIQATSNCIVEDCNIHTTLTSSSGYGVYMNRSGSIGSSNNIIRNNTIVTTGDGVFSGGDNANPPVTISSGNIVSNNQITSNRIAIEMFGGSPYSNISDNTCVITGNGTISAGISIGPADYSTITGNTCKVLGTLSYAGIEIAIASHCTATGNTVFGNGTCLAGFALSSQSISTNVTVAGNTVDSCVKGIYSSIPHSTIVGNSISNCTGNGIETNTVDNITCQDNQVQTSGVGIIIEEASYVTCGGNIIQSTGNGLQFTATAGTTRNFINGMGNISISGANPIVFTGSHFGNEVVFDQLLVAGGSNYGLNTFETAMWLQTLNGLQLKIVDASNVVNAVNVTGGSTGVGAMVYVDGETNIDLRIAAKGTGSVKVTTGFLVPTVTNNITAAGTNSQSLSTPLTTDINEIGTAAANSGVRLPPTVAGMTIRVINRGVSTVHVYPASGSAIDALGANAAFDMISNLTKTFVATTSTQWYST